MLGVETKGVYRDQADLLDLRVVVFDKKTTTLQPKTLESGTATLIRSESTSSKQILQRISFDSVCANDDGSFRIFFLHPHSLENLFYQVDAQLSGGLDYTKLGTFAKIPHAPSLINTQPDLSIPQSPPNVGEIGDPLAPLAGVTLSPPLILPQFFDLVDGNYVVRPILGYKKKADVFVKGEEYHQKEFVRARHHLPPPYVVPILSSPSSGKVYDLITKVLTVAPGVTIPPHGVVSINSNGLAIPATASSSGGTLGISIPSLPISGGQPIRILLVGRTKVFNAGVPLQAGGAVWVGTTPGSATTTQPSPSSPQIGTAITGDEISISISDLQ